MANSLADPAHRAAGLKQTLKAISAGRAARVVLALDADEEIQNAVRDAASQSGIPLETAESMRELGKACGIQVNAAAAAVLRD
jgi:large subunit ribosomal protein L7A